MRVIHKTKKLQGTLLTFSPLYYDALVTFIAATKMQNALVISQRTNKYIRGRPVTTLHPNPVGPLQWFAYNTSIMVQMIV